MSNIPISSLPVAISLTGAESVPIVQGGTTKRTTVGAIVEATSFPTSGIPFVLAADGGLSGQRILAPESTVTTVTDGGAGSTITVGIAAHGVTNAKLAQMAAMTVKANVTAGTANAADVAIAAFIAALYAPVVIASAGPYAVPIDATFIVINKTDGANVVLPALASKIAPVTIVAAQGTAHPFNVTLTDGTIIGSLATYPFSGDYQAATFSPVTALTTWAVN